MTTPDLDDPAQGDAAPPPPPPTLTGRTPLVVGIVAVVIGVAGAVAVFTTDNEVGTATLIAVGLYLAISAIQGRFPRFKLGDNEFDPSIAIQARRESKVATGNAVDAKEGLADTREKVAHLEAAVAALGTTRRPGLPTTPPQATASAAPVLDPALEALAREYNEVRWTMPSGPARSARMTEIVERMIAASTPIPALDTEPLLRSQDRGLRLAGIAYLNTHPDPGAVDLLADVTLTEDKAFNEYWGYVTLRKALRGHCDALTPTLRRRLQERLAALRPGTGLSRSIEEILTDCP